VNMTHNPTIDDPDIFRAAKLLIDHHDGTGKRGCAADPQSESRRNFRALLASVH